ncbi:hypothetical protein BJY52DRAFT_1282222 [Lactarius psammicola]|nr:hypothetical protein BJY52DRAFT_1282222 [Lactarius psammicola]
MPVSIPVLLSYLLLIGSTYARLQVGAPNCTESTTLARLCFAWILTYRPTCLISCSTWSFNCTTKATPETFSEPVPTGTRVPHWAYIDSSVHSPEVTGTASIVLTSTSEVAQSTTTSHHSSNAGVIAGGVIGGAIGATLIAGVVFWFAIRRRRTRYAAIRNRPLPHSLAEGAPRFDVSLYPRTLQIQRRTRARVPASDQSAYWLH